MGYLTEYYSRIIKHPGWLFFKERREARVSVRLMRHLFESIFKKIPEEVKEHKVTHALKDLKREEKDIKKVIETEDKLVLNIEIQQDKELDKIKDIEDNFEKEIRQIRKKSIAKNKRAQVNEIEKLREEFVYGIQINMEKFIKMERSNYKQEFIIIDASEKDNKTFMNEMTNWFKDKDVSLGRYWVMRSDLRKFKVNMKSLEKYGNKLKDGLKELSGEVDKKELEDKAWKKMINNLRKYISLIGLVIENSLKYSYFALRRVFNLLTTLLYYLATLEKEEDGWVKGNLMPKDPLLEEINNLEKLKIKLRNDARSAAQGIRVLVSEAGKIKSKA